MAHPDPSIYTHAALERGTPILAEEARRLDLFWDVLAEEWLAWDGHSWLDTEARAKLAWLRTYAAPSPQLATGSDAELRINEYFACIESRESDPLVPAAPPQESDKGRDDETRDYCRLTLPPDAEIAILRIQVRQLKSRVAELHGWCAAKEQIAKRAVRERDETRAALLAYQEALRSAVSEARPALWCYPSGVLEYACPFCGEGTMRKSDDPQPQTVADIKHRDGCFVLVARPAPADVATPSSTLELADLLRKRYPRLLERGNPLYDGVLAAAVERAGAADAVTVPREEINDAWAGEGGAPC